VHRKSVPCAQARPSPAIASDMGNA
jgi:hypothetical protein